MRISAGTVAGLARRAATLGRPLFVLWLDAHSDFHTLETTQSGNLHGVPVAYFTGRPGFEGYLPPLPAPVDPARVCMIGIRSVDPAERRALVQTPITVHDMRMIDEHGVGGPAAGFPEAGRGRERPPACQPGRRLSRPRYRPGGRHHGARRRDLPRGASGHGDAARQRLVTSLDLVELNPFLDERGRTAKLLVDLAASLMGRRVMDRPTRSF